MTHRRRRHPLRWVVLVAGAVFLLAACGGTESRGDDTVDGTATRSTVSSAADTEDGEGAAAGDDEAATADESDEDDDASRSLDPVDAATDAADRTDRDAAGSAVEDSSTGTATAGSEGEAPATTVAPPVTTAPTTTAPTAPEPPAPEPMPTISADEIARIEAQLDEIDRLLGDLEASLASD